MVEYYYWTYYLTLDKEWKIDQLYTLRFIRTFQHPGSTCGLDILCAEVVLDCKGDSIQRTFGGT